MNNIITTASGFRCTPVDSQANPSQKETPNWLFLPGGPGLGSEYFQSYLETIDLPGKLWRMDFPGDGSNLLDKTVDYNQWSAGLIEAVKELAPAVLVTHSFSGMLALTVPELEDLLAGFVIMDSAPNKLWRSWPHFTSDHPKKLRAHIDQIHLSRVDELQAIYDQNKNNETFKNLTLSRWEYFISAQKESEAKKLFASLPYSEKSFAWAQEYFHPTYEATWVPQKVPTLILAGSEDVLTPIFLFQKNKRFHRENITITEIPGGSHFPWMEQPKLVEAALKLLRFKIDKS